MKRLNDVKLSIVWSFLSFLWFTNELRNKTNSWFVYAFGVIFVIWLVKLIMELNALQQILEDYENNNEKR